MTDLKKQRILIVDDERTNIMALAQILKPRYEILAAKDGISALKVAEDQVPDLILLDVLMEDMDGFEVLVKLKDSDTTRGIPVIFITGLDNIHDEEKGFFLGAVDYITKPFHDSIVNARVKTHLQMAEYIRTIERRGMVDALTNISNRRGFDEHLDAEWGRARREQTSVSLLMLDVDRFKRYNDKYGHPQGDVLLQNIAKIITRSLRRSSDFAARWGGEEFTVLLPNTQLAGAMDVAEKIRTDVENAIIPNADGTGTNITVSIGACSLIPTIGSTSTELVSGADKALYNAKNGGRNRVCFWEVNL